MNAFFAMIIFAAVLCFAQENDAQAHNTYALLVATESFADANISRPGVQVLCQKNALALQRNLPEQNITALCDPQSATRANVIASASTIRDRAQVGDTILFLFIGLGIGGDFGEPMFLTYDFTPTAENAANTSIRVDEMAANLYKEGVQTIFMLDASFNAKLQLIADDDARTVMTAGPIASDVPSKFLSISHSSGAGEWPQNDALFGSTLAAGLDGSADINNDSEISPSEINRYIVSEINTQTGMLPGVRGAWKNAQDPIIVMAKDISAQSAIQVETKSWRPVAPKALKHASWITGASMLVASGASYAMAWKAQNCLEEVCFHGSEEHDRLIAQRSAWLWTSRATGVIGAVGIGAGIILRPDGATASIATRW
jgi:hypothetical protein